jgi:hypothetical protein
MLILGTVLWHLTDGVIYYHETLPWCSRDACFHCGAFFGAERALHFSAFTSEKDVLQCLY